MNAAAQEGLLFRWEAPRRRKLAILGFIAASLAGHAFCFYLFQIVYPPTVSLLPPPGRVSVITENAANQSFLRWIEAEDPALTFTTQRSPEARAFQPPILRHQPSYLTSQPPLREFPPIASSRVPTTAWPPAAVSLQTQRALKTDSAVRTAVIFSHDFDSLGAVAQPAMIFEAATRETPQSARFRIAVNDSGVVRYCVLESSSGDNALDEQARRYLTLCRFAGKTNPAAPNELIWGVAIIEWGNDIHLPAASSGISP